MNRFSSTEDKVASIVGLKTNANGTKTLKILNSKYAIADLNTTGTSIVTSYIYTSSTSSNVYTYMNGYGSFGGVDAAFLDYRPSNERAKVKISGVSGWITNTVTDKYGQSYVNYDVVPISLLKSTNYYYVNSDNEGQGLIFYKYKIGNRDVWGHNGGDPGVSTDMYFDKERKTGYIIFNNRSDAYSETAGEALLLYANQ
jgi:hypothetical protein